jgi:hypothetical protein
MSPANLCAESSPSVSAANFLSDPAISWLGIPRPTTSLDIVQRAGVVFGQLRDDPRDTEASAPSSSASRILR